METSSKLIKMILAQIIAAINSAVAEGYVLEQLAKRCHCTVSFLCQIRSGQRGPGITFVKLIDIWRGLEPWIKTLTSKPLFPNMDNMDDEERKILEALYEIATGLEKVSSRNRRWLLEIYQDIKEDDLKDKLIEFKE